jgi:hypothetical protein
VVPGDFNSENPTQGGGAQHCSGVNLLVIENVENWQQGLPHLFQRSEAVSELVNS